MFEIRPASPRRLTHRFILALCACFVLALVAVAPASASFDFRTKWGSFGTGDGQFFSPGYVASDSSGNVYVSDEGNYRIQKFDSNGNFITKWGSFGTDDGQFSLPTGIATDADGNVYVGDTSNPRIQKFDSNGNFITKWGSSGTGDGQFSSVYGVAADADGNIYVDEGDRIQKFDSSGNFITKWGSSGTGDGQFSSARGVATDSAGNVYVADTFNQRIQKFDSSGNFITKWGSSGTGDGQFISASGVGTDSAGDVYVASSNRIQKFDSNGTFLTKWGSLGSGDGEFDQPRAIAFDPSGNAYVADTSNHRIQKFGEPLHLTVNSTNDDDDGLCEPVPSGDCSLREAINRTNDDIGKDTIDFDIAGAGTHTISPTSALPIVTDPVVIDAGCAATKTIELDGSGAGNVNGLTISAGSSTVRGLAINRFAFDGIQLDSAGSNHVECNYIGTDVTGSIARPNLVGLGIEDFSGAGNTIGGTSAADRNVISGNAAHGVFMRGLDAGGNSIQGNYIGTDASGSSSVGNSNSGIAIERNTAGNTIGGTVAGARNVISGNGGSGVRIDGGSGNLVEGNYIGTDAGGSVAVNNAFGVAISDFAVGPTNYPASNNVVGGSTPEARNVISGNTNQGVAIAVNIGFSPQGEQNSVRGNYIGTDASGTFTLGNQRGVEIQGPNNTVGGTSTEDRNVISGNDEIGVMLAFDVATGNLVQGNYIGTDAAGLVALGNSSAGVYVNDGVDNIIGGSTPGAGNLIAFNDSGVFVLSGAGNAIQGNSISSNGALGIDLFPFGVTPNDSGDADSGPNNLQNFPVLTTASSGGGETTVEGSLNSEASKTYRLEFFANAACDASGNGEGATFLGSKDVITDGSGDVAFSATGLGASAAGDAITATATDPDNNTSEFSACWTVDPPETPTFTVSSTDDTDDGLCGTAHCSLREAINRANAESGTDTIDFDIAGAGTHTISPSSALPTITDPVVIDAGCAPTKTVELDGSGAGSANGLTISAGSSTVRGLAINRFGGRGIRLESGGSNHVECNYVGTDPTGTTALGNDQGVDVFGSAANTIGGTGAGDGNVISANNGMGVFVGQGASAMGNQIEGNLIGTNADGTAALGNLDAGIAISSPDNAIGGTSAAARNVISANGSMGIHVGRNSSSDATNNSIEGNYIGTDSTGTVDLGNTASGVDISNYPSNTVGGTAAGAGNTISGNNEGVRIENAAASGNAVQGNLIGTDASGGAALGNSRGVVIALAPGNVVGGGAAGAGNVISGNASDGLLVLAATDNRIEGNQVGTTSDGISSLANGGFGVSLTADASANTVGGTAPGEGNEITASGFDGVLVGSGTGNRITSNSIHGNDGLGIDLGPNDDVTTNDPGDTDSGVNNLQNFPVLTTATSGASATVQGTLNSDASKTYRLEFFSSVACDPSGNGEGATLLGSKDVTTNGSGDVSFSATGLGASVPGDAITATATDPDSNTSEFSPCQSVSGSDSDPPETTIDSGPSGTTSDRTPTFSFSSDEPGSTFECRIDTDPFGPCSGPGDTHTTSSLNDGSHTFEVRATDAATNTDQSPASRTFTVDAAPPAVPNLTATDPSSPANDNSPKVKGSAETGSTVRIYSSSDCSGSALATGSAAQLDDPGITVAVADDSTTELRATATDEAGNMSSCSDPLSYVEDSQAPNTTIDSGPVGTTADTTPTFIFSTDEPGSSFECAVDGAAFAACTSPLTTATLSGGAHTFDVRATDGAGNTDQSPASRPFEVETSGATFASVDAGSSYTCGVRSNGSVACWGNNGAGKATPPGGSFSSVSAGGNHTCGVKTDGSVACWGYNASTEASPPGGSFSSVSAGWNHTCGVKTDQSVACWGSNAYGQASPPPGNFSSVSAGAFHTCGVKTDQSVACWGQTVNGAATPPGGSFSSVGAGFYHTCGVKTDQSVACWGKPGTDGLTPPGGSFNSVSGGYYYNCGIKTDQSVACWGNDSDGQGTPPGSSFSSVSAGPHHACGVKTDGSVACWGRNTSGETTPPDTASSSVTPSGGTLTTDSGSGPTPSDPTTTTVTVPAGTAGGAVSIVETSVTQSAASGFQFLGQQLNITAPAASAANPLTIVYRIDASLLPSGTDQANLQVFKNGTLVPNCTGPAGQASPDPCVSGRAALGGGDIQITVKTSTASAWNFGIPFTAKWGTKGSADGQFNKPHGIATDAAGNVYVADTSNNRIEKFSSTGTFLTKWGTKGSANGQFNNPYDVATDANANVYVADTSNGRVQKFSSSGAFLAKWGTKGTANGQFKNPHGIATDPTGNVYVADTSNSRVQRFSSTGTFLGKFGTKGSANGQLKNPYDLATDVAGNVYVGDTSNNRVQKFDATGTFLAKWGTKGSANGQFKNPHGVAIDSVGTVYVADTSNNRVQKFDASGAFLGKFGTKGSLDGQFKNPWDVATNPTGNVYVADTSNNRVQRFP